MNRLTVLFLAALAPSCLSLASTTLDGSELRYPVSFSKSLIDADGKAYVPTPDEKVAHFERSWSHWGMIYDSIDLSSDENLSAILHEEIEGAGGDGIVNLKVTADGTGFSWLVSLLILFPERVKVTVEGDVVRRSG